MELPQYTLKPNINRMVVPWVFELLGLAVLFYAGVYLLTKSMGIDIPQYINLFIIAFLVVLVVAQLFIYHLRFAKYKYEFYTNRIEFSGKKPITFLFNDFQEAKIRQNIFDKMFDTGSVVLGNFVIGPISNPRKINDYTLQLVNYHKQMQQGLRAQQARASMQKEMSR